MSAPSKVMVTGGNGFLGQRLCQSLREAGIQVTSLARRPLPELDAIGVRQIKGDVRDPECVRQAASGAELIFHIAAKVGVWGDAAEFHSINVEGTRVVLDACHSLGIQKLVFTSSPSVVFDGQDQDGIDESVPYPSRFLGHYPQTKALAEQMVLAAHGAKLQTVALRPHLIWGPGDPHLIPTVLAAARAGRLRVVGVRDKLVDAVFVDNAVDAHLRAMHGLWQGHAPIGGRAYFVTNAEPWPMARILAHILQAAGLSEATPRIPAWAAYAVGAACEGAWRLLRRDSMPPMTRFVARQLATAHWYDPRAAREELGYTPRISMAEGFEKLALSLETSGSPSSRLPSLSS